jgi:glycosyltransferase involved in cell wall biosynthesis
LLFHLHRLWPHLPTIGTAQFYEQYHREAVAHYFHRQGVRAVMAEYGMTGVAIMQAARRAGLPLIVHFHGYDAFQHEILDTFSERYREMFCSASAIVAVSRDMVNQLIRLGAPSEKVHRIPYGVDAEVFSAAKPEDVEPHFVAVGRFVDKKAPMLTLRSFAKARQRCPDARLTMIGDGPLRNACLALANALGIADAVNLPGVQPPAGVAETMRSSRAFVQHSIRALDGDSEGTPVAVIEAQSCGLPVVATRHAGIQDIVIDGETGCLVAECDVDGMAEAMVAMARNPHHAASLGRAGRHRVLEEFTLENSLGRLKSLLADVVEKGTG